MVSCKAYRTKKEAVEKYNTNNKWKALNNKLLGKFLR